MVGLTVSDMLSELGLSSFRTLFDDLCILSLTSDGWHLLTVLLDIY